MIKDSASYNGKNPVEYHNQFKNNKKIKILSIMVQF